ncbi:MAG: SCO family protein [Candidatus Rokuibacteriota bacterium]
MRNARLVRRSLLWGGVAMALAIGAGVTAWSVLRAGVLPIFGVGSGPTQSEGALEALGMYGDVPDFSLTERSGRVITRADLLGTVWIANFIYTQCTETCPLQTAELARLQGEFQAETDLRLVSITVDPERDTRAALSAYAERYGADPVRWLFLTGDKRAIYRFAKEGFRLGVVDPDDPGAQAGSLLRFLSPRPAWATHGSKGLIMHSARLVLVDRQARIRAYHLPNDDQSLERLRRNLKAVLRERRS